MGCTQPVTPMQTDKFTVNNILNNTVIRKQLKAMNMCFYWIQYQIKQDHFLVFWKIVMANREIFTKHHLQHHHREMWPIYIHIEATTKKYSSRVFSLLVATATLVYCNIIYIPKYNRNNTPKSKATQS